MILPNTAVRLLLLSLASMILMAACPLSQATYVLRRTGTDLLRIGAAEDGDVILEFTLGKRKVSIPLPQVEDRIQIQRLDAARRPWPDDLASAPAYILIRGLEKISDAPDGEWRLASCVKQ